MTTNAKNPADADKADFEKDRAKSENLQNKEKRKAEGNAASWVSPEHNELAGGDTYVEQKTVPDKMPAENEPQVQAIIKARDQKKA